MAGILDNIRDEYYRAKVPGYNPAKGMVVKLKLSWKSHFCFVELYISYFLTFYYCFVDFF